MNIKQLVDAGADLIDISNDEFLKYAIDNCNGWMDYKEIHNCVNEAFNEDNPLTVYLTGNRQTHMIFQYSDVKKVIIYSSAEGSVQKFDFYSCAELTDVTIENGIKTIPKGLFRECVRLPEIKLPSSIEKIEAQAFYQCVSLTEIDLSNTKVKTLYAYTFRDCDKLKVIKFPSKIKSLHSQALCGCGVESIVVPDTVTSIGKHVFSLCTNLKSVYIPNSVDKMEPRQFYGCDKLTDITIPKRFENCINNNIKKQASIKYI